MSTNPLKPKFDDCVDCKNWATSKCNRCHHGELFEEEDYIEAVDEVDLFALLKRIDRGDDE